MGFGNCMPKIKLLKTIQLPNTLQIKEPLKIWILEVIFISSVTSALFYPVIDFVAITI